VAVWEKAQTKVIGNSISKTTAAKREKKMSRDSALKGKSRSNNNEDGKLVCERRVKSGHVTHG